MKHSFRTRSNFPLNLISDLKNRFWGLEIKHLKQSKQPRMTRVFFLPLLSRNFEDDQEFHIFTGLLFCAYVEIHQVRRLVFNNYQWCPVPLNKLKCISNQYDTWSQLSNSYMCSRKSWLSPSLPITTPRLSRCVFLQIYHIIVCPPWKGTSYSYHTHRFA